MGTITWKSNPGTPYDISYSSDLTNFDLELEGSLPGAEGVETTTVNFNSPAPAESALFFQVKVQ